MTVLEQRSADASTASGSLRELAAGSGSLALCDASRVLCRESVGWSRQPLHLAKLHGPWLRQKRWNAWGIHDDRHYLMVGIMHLDYAAVASVYLYDLETGQWQQAAGRALGARGCSMSDTVEGQVRLATSLLSITADTNSAGTSLHISSPQAGGLEADLWIESPRGVESMNLVIPWSERRYHFTSKQACLPTGGVIRWGQRRVHWAPGAAQAWLDFARGVWPYRSAWRWAMCSTRVGSRPVGFNLGAGWTDGTGVNENALYIDGRVHKLPDDVRFEYDRQALDRPWAIRSVDSGRVNLEFTPARVHVDGMNLLLIRARLAQVLGTYRGTIVDDAGERIELGGAVGIAEDQQARW